MKYVRTTALLIALTVAAAVIDAAETPFQLVKDGKPACTIVLPREPVQPENAAADSAEMIEYRCQASLYGKIKRAAKMLSEDIQAFTGARIPIATDGEQTTGDLVLVGPTARTRELGLDDKELLAKRYVVIRAVGNQLILNGRANAYLDNGTKRRVRGYSGAAAAVYHFMEQRLGIHHFAPGKIGRECPPPTKDLSVPSDLDVTFNPSVLFGGEVGEIWGYADFNRGGKHGSFATYGGHSWIYQVPPEIYFDKEKHPDTYHPEYYALVNGQRITDAEHGGSLCTEHPDVLEISVENIRKVFDSGVDVVELGQPDSYDAQTACQCDACMKVGDTTRQGLGARIIKFHTAIARELLKSHPHKYVLHLMYGPSYHIPDTYKGPLPGNMMLEFCGGGDGLFERIEQYAHLKPAGVTIYVYEFTGFNPLGYGGPKSSVEAIKRLFAGVRKHRVQYIYWCGRAQNNFGMEGPQYWLAQQLQWDNDQDPDKLMDLYWNRYYQQAAGPMKALYHAIHEQKARAMDQVKEEYGSKLSAYSRHVYPAIFNDELNSAVAAYLAEARQQAGENDILQRRIRMVKESYDFNLVTRDCFAARDRFDLDKTVETLTAWRDTLRARNAFIEAMGRRWKAGEFEDFYLPVIPAMAFSNKAVARKLTVFGPFNVGDEHQLKRAVRHMKGYGIKSAAARQFEGPPDEETWIGIEPVNSTPMLENENGETAPVNAVVKLGWDKQRLYVRFACEEPTDRLIGNAAMKHDDDLEEVDAVEVIVIPRNHRGYPVWDRNKRFGVSAGGITRDVRTGYMRHAYDPEPEKPDPHWDGDWTAIVDEGTRPGAWTATLTIPWKDMDVIAGPEAQDGDKILMNFIRYRPTREGDEESATYAWMPTFGDVANGFRCGEIFLRGKD